MAKFISTSKKREILYTRRQTGIRRLEPPDCLTMTGLKTKFGAFFSDDQLLDVVVGRCDYKRRLEKQMKIEH